MITRCTLMILGLVFTQNVFGQIKSSFAIAFPMEGIKSIKLEKLDARFEPAEVKYMEYREYNRNGALVKVENSYGLSAVYGDLDALTEEYRNEGKGDLGECATFQKVVREGNKVTIYERAGNDNGSCFDYVSFEEELDCKYGLHPEVPRKIDVDPKYNKVTVLIMNEEYQDLVDRKMIYYNYQKKTTASLFELEVLEELTKDRKRFKRYSASGDDCLSRSWRQTYNMKGRVVEGREVLTYKYDEKGNWIEEKSDKIGKVTKRTIVYY